MNENNLLKKGTRIPRSGSNRKFVKYRRVKTHKPMEVLEMDIKFIWIPEKGKDAYLLSIIDVHSRMILNRKIAFSITKKQVIELCSEVFDNLGFPENVVIRSNNGSQFIASDVREYLNEIGVEQEFTHVATPEENAHIEAFHGVLKKELLNRFEYHTFEEIKELLDKYNEFYNNQRLHRSLNYATPKEVWNKFHTFEDRALAA